MANYELTVREYTGSFASLHAGKLLGATFWNEIGPSQSATIANVDCDFGFGSERTATFSVSGSAAMTPVNYIGDVTVSTVAGPEVDPRRLSIFESDGKIYFILPEGLPLLHLISIGVDVATQFSGLIPCFASGTRILTRRGNVLAETIKVGSKVMDNEGREHEVLWTGSAKVNLSALSEDLYAKFVPVRIKADILAACAAFNDLVVSQQHRIQVRNTMTAPPSGTEECFAPAVSLVGSLAEFATDIEDVTYYQILCAERVTLLANGGEAESLFPGDLLRGRVRPAVQKDLRMGAVQADAIAAAATAKTALLTLKTDEGRFLARAAKFGLMPKLPIPEAGVPGTKVTPRKPCRDTRLFTLDVPRDDHPRVWSMGGNRSALLSKMSLHRQAKLVSEPPQASTHSHRESRARHRILN